MVECHLDPRRDVEYGLRFVGFDPPFDLLLSLDCHFLQFMRGCEYASNGSGGGVQCVADEVRALMEGIFKSRCEQPIPEE